MLSSEIISVISAGLLGCLASCLLTPLMRWAAPHLRLVDSPDPHRKLHASATPVGGGLAVFLASLFGIALVHFLVNTQAEITTGDQKLMGFFIASSLIVAVGVLDDAFGMRGRQKLVGQITAGLVLCYFGLTIHHVQLFDWQIDLGIFAIPFTVAWFLGAINAINLLDGADGMASTVGIVICGAIAFMSQMGGHTLDALIAAALAGALLGFLFYNFPPASIFLGDCGSMLIGLAIGVLAVRTSLKGPTTVALATPLALMAIPIFDCGAAVARRWLTGRSVYATDRGHLHHCLLRRGVGPRGLLVWVAILCVGTAGGALASVYFQNEQTALISTAIVILLLVVMRVFGYGEIVLILRRLMAFGNSLLTPAGQGSGGIRQQTTVLQGSRNWEKVWRTVTDFADVHRLCKVRLVLNLAWMHEAYHAEWERSHNLDASDQWFTRLPLTASGRKIGQLEFTGPAAESARGDCEMLELLSELLDALSAQFEDLSTELPRDLLADTEPRLSESLAQAETVRG